LPASRSAALFSKTIYASSAVSSVRYDTRHLNAVCVQERRSSFSKVNDATLPLLILGTGIGCVLYKKDCFAEELSSAQDTAKMCLDLIELINFKDPEIQTVSLQQLYHLLSDEGDALSFPDLVMIEKKLRKISAVGSESVQLHKTHKLVLELIATLLRKDVDNKKRLQRDPDFLRSLEPLAVSDILAGMVFIISSLFRERPEKSEAANIQEIIAFKEAVRNGSVDKVKLDRVCEVAISEKKEPLLLEIIDDITKVIEARHFKTMPYPFGELTYAVQKPVPKDIQVMISSLTIFLKKKILIAQAEGLLNVHSRIESRNFELKQYAFDKLVYLSQTPLPKPVKNHLLDTIRGLKNNKFLAIQAHELSNYFDFGDPEQPAEKAKEEEQPVRPASTRSSSPTSTRASSHIFTSPGLVERHYNLQGSNKKILALEGSDDLNFLSKDYIRKSGSGNLLRVRCSNEKNFWMRIGKKLKVRGLIPLQETLPIDEIKGALAKRKDLVLDLQKFNIDEEGLQTLQQIHSVNRDVRIMLTRPRGDLSLLTEQYPYPILLTLTDQEPKAKAKPRPK